MASKKNKKRSKRQVFKITNSVFAKLKKAKKLFNQDNKPDPLAYLKTPLSSVSIEEIVVDVVCLSLGVEWEHAKLIIFRAAEILWCREIVKHKPNEFMYMTPLIQGLIKIKGVKHNFIVDIYGGIVKVKASLEEEILDVKAFQLKALEEILD